MYAHGLWGLPVHTAAQSSGVSTDLSGMHTRVHANCSSAALPLLQLAKHIVFIAVQAYRVACHVSDSEDSMHAHLQLASHAVMDKLVLFMLKEVYRTHTNLSRFIR